MNIVEENWPQILEKMKSEYCSSNIAYTTWIEPLTVYEVSDDTVYILVKLKASLEHIEEKYIVVIDIVEKSKLLDFSTNPNLGEIQIFLKMAW